MAGLDQHLNDPEYVNWVKNTMALKITQDVLKPYVLQELSAIHMSFTDIVPYGNVCSSCDVRRAPYCPNNVCNIYKNEIELMHRFHHPTFINTNTRKWLTDAWEIAKCFMPPLPVYKRSTPSNADFSAIINFIINCRHFDKIVSCNLDLPENIFQQVRTMRNELMFSESLTISTATLERNLDLLVRLLSSLVVKPPNFPEAVERLKRLKEGNDRISLDRVLDARREAVLAISEVLDEENQEREDSADSVITMLRNEIQTASPSLNAERYKLINSFIISCKYSLIRLVQKKIESEKPKRYQQQEWDLHVFLTNIKKNQHVEALVDKHKDMLYPEDSSHSDIKKWGIFLLCHILCLETRGELPIRLKDYVQKLRAMRNKILAGHSDLGEKDLHSLYHSLDEPLRTEVEQIQASEGTIDSPDTQRLLHVLDVWTRDEETMHATIYTRRQEPVPKKADPSDGKFVEQDGLGYYQTDKMTGYLLILNFEKNREHTNLDVKNLKDFFSNELSFKVNSPRDEMENDFTTEEVKEWLIKTRQILSDENESKKYYCFVCVIFSHGSLGVFNTRNGKFEIETVREMFCNEKMKTFTGKPKIFFIQACRGDKIQRYVRADDERSEADRRIKAVVESQRPIPVTIPNDADTLVAYATTPGFMAFREDGVGSWFISECMLVFRSFRRTNHLEDMLVTVRERVASNFGKMEDVKEPIKQMPCIWSTLRKRLFLKESQV